METNNNGIPNEENLDTASQNQEMQNDGAAQMPDDSSTRMTENQDEHVKHRHYTKHSYTRYKMFSNHSSWNDSPHTNTSF